MSKSKRNTLTLLCPSDPYVALIGNGYVDSADTLADLLHILDEVCDTPGSEDVVVWQGSHVRAVRFANGNLVTVRGDS